MIAITPTGRSPWAVEFLEYHVIPMLLAFALGLLAMDWRAEQVQAPVAQALHDQLHRANSDSIAADVALTHVLALLAQADDVCNTPAGMVRPVGGALRTCAAAGQVAP